MNETFRLAPQEWARLRALLDEALALPPEVFPLVFAGLPPPTRDEDERDPPWWLAQTRAFVERVQMRQRLMEEIPL